MAESTIQYLLHHKSELLYVFYEILLHSRDKCLWIFIFFCTLVSIGQLVIAVLTESLGITVLAKVTNRQFCGLCP